MSRDPAAMSDPDHNPQFQRFAAGRIRFRGEHTIPAQTLRPRGPAKNTKSPSGVRGFASATVLPTGFHRARGTRPQLFTRAEG